MPDTWTHPPVARRFSGAGRPRAPRPVPVAGHVPGRLERPVPA